MNLAFQFQRVNKDCSTTHTWWAVTVWTPTLTSWTTWVRCSFLSPFAAFRCTWCMAPELVSRAGNLSQSCVSRWEIWEAHLLNASKEPFHAATSAYFAHRTHSSTRQTPILESFRMRLSPTSTATSKPLTQCSPSIPTLIALKCSKDTNWESKCSSCVIKGKSVSWIPTNLSTLEG